MKFADAPKDVQNGVRHKRMFGRKRIEPPDGELWWNEPDTCSVCGPVKGARLAEDHCHVTGLIRGRLCYSCNGVADRSTSPLWVFWRRHAPGFDNREFYWSSWSGWAEPTRLLTEDEVMTLPVGELLDLARARFEAECIADRAAS